MSKILEGRAYAQHITTFPHPETKKLSTPLNRVNVSDNIWSGPVPTSLFVPAGLMSTSTSIFSAMNFLRQN